jgi:hypothetical protein
MKKMNKTYEAPMAEMINMQMPTVLMGSPAPGEGGMDAGGGNTNNDPSLDD